MGGVRTFCMPNSKSSRMSIDHASCTGRSITLTVQYRRSDGGGGGIRDGACVLIITFGALSIIVTSHPPHNSIGARHAFGYLRSIR